MSIGIANIIIENEIIHILDCLLLKNENDYIRIESDLDKIWNLLIILKTNKTQFLNRLNNEYIHEDTLNHLHKYINFKINNRLNIL